jgi:two-component system heavy metal sensor histidine kinase CusS
LILLGSLVFFAAVGFLLARRTYKPFLQMIRRANEIRAANLGMRLEPPPSGQELAELAQAFNDLFDRLQEAFQRERDFNVQVAHELRTPLTALRGNIESVLLDETLTPRHRDALTNTISAADRLIDLINRLLFLSKAESGLKPAIRREVFRIEPVLAEICELVFPDEEDRNARLTLDVPGSLECLADKHMLRRLALILLENAKHHTPPGTEIVIHAGRESGALRIEVRDRGKGIPESERERIFEKFFTKARGGATVRGPGTGLGLSIARSIARLHNGDLICGETPGGGATFICSIPSG